MSFSLLIKNLLFTVFVPGTAVFVIPYLLLEGQETPVEFSMSPVVLPAYPLFLAGLVAYLWCVYEFATRGQGTPAPTDPPKRLVVSGLYRWNRNPMYQAVLTMLFSIAWIFLKDELLVYATCTFIVFHTFVRLYEEPKLRSLFGQDYADYCAAVPRWGIARTAYGHSVPTQRSASETN